MSALVQEDKSWDGGDSKLGHKRCRPRIHANFVVGVVVQCTPWHPQAVIFRCFCVLAPRDQHNFQPVRSLGRLRQVQPIQHWYELQAGFAPICTKQESHHIIPPEGFDCWGRDRTFGVAQVFAFGEVGSQQSFPYQFLGCVRVG
jgi:hypothetical protein